MEFVGITVLFLDEKVARCSSMYKITDHPFLIRFISLTIIDEVTTDAPEINLQSRLDCSTISKVSYTMINTNNNDFCLHITHQIKEKQTQPHQEIQEIIPTDTNAATTSPLVHSSCLLNIAYMLNVNGSMLLSSYEKFIYSFKTH
ncbi:hypothetical protein IGI04_039909 [Brassica rapa subsp. trilocularis]|uniref:DUF223 domain-containing protein n=1 Tax=Brassica rapa subsp. trilocularis TaxID=1813537 RepID=A0ABQ7KQK7_BRACM|nr:hypothetical protein IGI04_039909 [Brassica rapa subsp. trilocularis]